MIDKITTPEEAGRYRYGTWTGNPNGTAYQKEYCAFEVWPPRTWIPHQCRKRNGKGLNGLYCGIHAKKFLQT